MTHYILSSDTGTILQIVQNENEARLVGMALAKAHMAPVALHYVIAKTCAPVGGSVSMIGVFQWFKPSLSDVAGSGV